jgi:hypothetical protein
LFNNHFFFFISVKFSRRAKIVLHYHQSLDHVQAQLRILNEKDLIQSKESYIATGYIDPELDQNILTKEVKIKVRTGIPAWPG